MKLKKATILVVLFLYLASCATSSKRLNHLRVGMTRDEVIEVMGEPNETRAAPGGEVLVYHLAQSEWSSRTTEYWLVIDGEKLQSYGKPGDWGTANPQTIKIINH